MKETIIMERTRCVMFDKFDGYLELTRILNDLSYKYTVMDFDKDGDTCRVVVYKMDLIKHQWILNTIRERCPDTEIREGEKY